MRQHKPNIRSINWRTGCANIVVLLCLCISGRAFPQSSVLDSLKEALTNVDTGEVRVEILHRIATEVWDYDFDEGLHYSEEAFRLSRQINYAKGMVQSLTDMGQFFYFKGDYAMARHYYQKALAAAGTSNFGDYPAHTASRLGKLYRVQGEFDSAEFYFQMSLVLLKDHPNAGIALSSTYFNLGILYENLSKYDQAIALLRKAMVQQQNKKDSIQLAESWAALGNIMTKRNMYDSARYYLSGVKRVAHRYNNPLLLTQYYMYEGDLFQQTGEYSRALDAYSRSLEYIEMNNFKRFYAIILRQLGQTFCAIGNFDRSLENLLNSLRISEQINSQQEIAMVNNLIGWLYVNDKNDSLALIHARRALTIMEKINDEAGVARCYNLIGYAHYMRAGYEAALANFSKALAIHQKMELKQEEIYTLFYIGKLYYKKGDNATALKYHKRILEPDIQSGDRRFLAMIYNSLASVFIAEKDFKAAEQYLAMAGTIARSINAPVVRRDNYKLFADLSKSMGDYRKAATYYERYIQLNDSIFRNESITRMAELNVMYLVDRKEREVRALYQENEHKQSQISIQQARIRLQKNFLIFFFAALIMLTGLMYMLFKYYRVKSKANRELLSLNRHIRENTEEIQAQSEELIEANKSLSKLNNELIEKREEIQAQSEELIEANEIITRINQDLERTIRERTDQLRQAYIELDTFFYRSSHDFRRPLTTFLGLAEVAKVTVKDTNALELFEKVRETAVNLDKMLVKLQSVSDVGTQQLVYREVYLQEMVSDVLDNLRGEIEKKGINVLIDFNVEREFISYPVLVKIVIENLIENSVHFCGVESPFVHLRMKERGATLVIEIEDNGQGIPPEYANRIFDMYFRANYSSKGNGLGLYIVKKAVQKLNGKITFKSDLYRGSVFTLEIPFHETSSPAVVDHTAGFITNDAAKLRTTDIEGRMNG